MRILWISAGVLVALLVVTLVGSSLWIGAYVRGNEFRSLISGATGGVFDATAGFDPLRWTGASVYSESARLEGRPGAALRQMEARQLRAEVNWRAAFSGAWRVEEISITRLQGEWMPLPPGSRTADSTIPDNSKSPAGIAAFLPHRFELGSVKIGMADLAFGGVKITDSALTIKPDGAGWIFQGSGGELRLPLPPPLLITNFRAREQGGDYFLTEGNLRLGENGKISISGESTAGGNLQAAWEGINSADVLPGEWKKRLGGTMSGNANITFPDRASGAFQLQDGRLENIPLLGTVADFTGNPSFRRMPLQEVSADFSCDKGIVRLKKCVMESKGLMRLEGELTIGKSGELQGRFEMGVTPQTLQWLPGSRERVFKTARNGYVWTEVIVGGTIEHPTENLSGRLASAMGTEVIELGKDLIKDTPGAAEKGVQGVMDILRPFVP